jgi:methylmalonyl-CoA/ethylmalonyl-CoA epimerase
MIKKMDHVAIAVSNLEEAAKFYQQVMGLTLSGVEVVAAQKTKVGFLKIGDVKIELVQPSEPDSPLVKFLEGKGQGIHHLCFEVDDVEAEVKAFLEKGATMVDQRPRPGAHNTKVAFVHPKSSSGVLIELNEFPKKE